MIIRIKRKTLEQGILSIFVLFAIVSILIGVSFTTNYVTGEVQNQTNRTIIAIVNVTNTEPNITSIRIYDRSPGDGLIDLTADDITIVTCNATVFDFNGFRDIVNITENISLTNATFFIQSVGLSANDDNNSHYTNRSCGRCRNATSAEAGGNPFETTAICDCRFAVQYYANASNDWACNFAVQDAGGDQVESLKLNLTDTETNATVTVTELLAISAPAILDYGNLSVTQTSAEIVHNVTNVGNIDFNLSLRGFGGDNESIGQNLSMICDFGNISIGAQRYTTVSGTAYADMRNLTNQTVILTNLTSPEVNITWPQRIDDNNFGADRNSTFWTIKVPLSVGGLCNGTIVFGAVDAS